ncbi:IS200/IS605 family transposase [Polluticaenibacter yanchengensis]|uniref:IS200/IS605 family transposase n=1 Tax=Polluticaenibacter yanchengensis TaxID=3014562 RepID=A0ABT4UMU3_9BACT|nr:IS200/IS605 family transposase [Chitinophagaceae bacterium LY-5]
MANTYSQLNIHCVFAVKSRQSFLNKELLISLNKYISGIMKNKRLYPLAVNGWKDHIHIFFELNPNEKISDIIRVIKSQSSKWINDNKFIPGMFNWQEGYGAFSYSRSQRNDVIKYIENQEIHHKGTTFREEYLLLLKKFEIKFDDNYLFEFYD